MRETINQNASNRTNSVTFLDGTAYICGWCHYMLCIGTIGHSKKDSGSNACTFYQNEILDFIFSLYFTGIKRITFEEFLPILHAVAQKCPKKPKPEEFFEGLKVFDKDGYGVVLSGELRHVLTSLGKPVFTFKYLM